MEDIDLLKAAIAEAMENCTDANLLDFVWRLLAE